MKYMIHPRYVHKNYFILVVINFFFKKYKHCLQTNHKLIVSPDHPLQLYGGRLTGADIFCVRHHMLEELA
jgi:hypothetical protein